MGVRKFLSSVHSDLVITNIIEKELESTAPSTSSRFSFMDHQGVERSLSRGDLAEIRKARLQGDTAFVNVGSIASVQVGYSDLRVDESTFEQLKKVFCKGDGKNDTSCHPNLRSDATLLPCLDPNHPNFSTELCAAIEAWTDLHGDKDKKLPQIGVLERVKRWQQQEQKYQFEGDAVVNRISTIITPDKLKTKNGTPLTALKNNGLPRD